MNKTALLILVSLFIIIRLVFIAFTPLTISDPGLFIPAFNDEASHYNYVAYLAEKKQFPVQVMTIHDSGAFTINELEYFQPPLYYMLAVPFYEIGKAFFPSRPFLCVRFFSLLLVMTTIIIIYRTMLLLFPATPQRAGHILVFLGLLGPLVRGAALVSNDALLWLMSAVLFYCLLQATINSMTLNRILMLSFVCAIGLVTKSSFFFLYPALFIPALLRDDQTTLFPLKKWLWPIGIVVASCLLAAPWYIRNMLIYSKIMWVDITPHHVPFTLQNITIFFFYSIHTFWFPFFNFILTPGLKCLTVVMAVITLFMSSVFFLNVKKYFLTAEQKKIFCVLMTCLAGAFTGYFYFNILCLQPETRYLFIALPAIALIITLALERIWQKALSVYAAIALINVLVYGAAVIGYC